MTFEQLFTNKLGDLLATQMGETLTQRGLSVVYKADVEVSNDLFFEPLKKNADGIVMVVSTTNSTQTNVPSIDFTTDFFNVRILCDENKKTKLFEAIESINQNNNAIYQTLTDGTTTYNFQLSLNKPYVSLNRDLQLDEKDDDGISESIGVILVQWIISCVYTKSVQLGAPSVKVVIGGTEYDVKGLSKYSWHQGTSDVITQYEGSYTQSRETALYTDTHTLVFSKTANDSLCTLLENIKKRTSSLYNKTIQLKIDSTTITIKSYMVDEAYEGGVSTYTLTLVI